MSLTYFIQVPLYKYLRTVWKLHKNISKVSDVRDAKNCQLQYAYIENR